MDRFLQINNLQRLRQEEIENMNRPTTSIEIESVIFKNLGFLKKLNSFNIKYF